MIISGTYFDGKVLLDSTPNVKTPTKVKIIFEEQELDSELKLSDFNFKTTQLQLKDISGNFSEAVIQDRRES
jgi:hypothetical protein